jgi:hypothetical protein
MPDHRQYPHDDRRALEQSKWGDRPPPPKLLFAHMARYGMLGTWFLAFGAMLLREVPDRLRELVTLRTCVVRDFEYGWVGHVLIALHLGLSLDDIAGTAVGFDAFHGHDAAIVRAVDAVLANRAIDAKTRRLLGERDVLAITFAALFYDAVATEMSGAAPEPGTELIAGLETPARAVSYVAAVPFDDAA